ncbi:MAG: hypothetical protein QXD43_00880 [Candidatus Aenigmatarchaeota archaeon]
MALFIPEFPAPRPWFFIPPERPEAKLKFEPGEMINAIPYEGEMLLDFTSSMGKVSEVFYGLVFQLPKWGFFTTKIEESIFVSPVFREYYDLTIRQKEALEARIKEGLASISRAISDFELVLHDLRKYQEYMDYFLKIENGKRLIKEGKKEEGERLVTEGEQTLRAIFIDEVDVHTGEGIALKLIAPRWPTIIADFMKLSDEDTNPKKIAEKLKVSEAQGVVLATKNKLYIEWREMFRENVKERYKRILGLVEARKASIDEYKEMLRPTLARYKMITDALSSSTGRAGVLKSAFIRTGAQAVSLDRVVIWAWRPFQVAEKYKITREYFDEIPASKAGFTQEEINELRKIMPNWKGMVHGLPQEPSIDGIVRLFKPIVEMEYGVKITAHDLYKARELLLDQFRKSLPAFGGKEAWIFSPYFTFICIPMDRTVIRLPDGSQMEDLWIENLYAATRTQNIILVNCLELIARDKQLEEYMNLILGEYGKKEGKVLSIDEILRETYGIVYKSEDKAEKKVKEKSQPLKLLGLGRSLRKSIGKLFSTFGLEVRFFRAIGPYEFAMHHRLAKYHQRETGGSFSVVVNYLKKSFGVPG